MSRPRPTAARFPARYLPPTVALAAAVSLLVISLFLPYWELTLTPAGGEPLRLVSFLDHVEGPVDGVLAQAGKSGEAPLRQLVKLERSLAVATATVVSLLVVAAIFVRNRYAALLSLPALSFPWIVVADTRRWLQQIAGGLSEAAGEAPPRAFLLGRTTFGSTVLEMRPGSGLFLAMASSLVVVAGLWFHRRAYRERPEAREPTRAE